MYASSDELKTSKRKIRLPKELFYKLQIIAEKKNISLNDLIIQCCDCALNEMEDEKPQE